MLPPVPQAFVQECSIGVMAQAVLESLFRAERLGALPSRLRRRKEGPHPRACFL